MRRRNRQEQNPVTLPAPPSLQLHDYSPLGLEVGSQSTVHPTPHPLPSLPITSLPPDLEDLNLTDAEDGQDFPFASDHFDLQPAKSRWSVWYSIQLLVFGLVIGTSLYVTFASSTLDVYQQFYDFSSELDDLRILQIQFMGTRTSSPGEQSQMQSSTLR